MAKKTKKIEVAKKPQKSKFRKLKNLETASMWCAIGSLLVFFGNLIAFVAILVIGGTSSSFNWGSTIFALTIITENLSLACILAWMIMAIIEMVMISKNQELKKYHFGSYASWIIAMVISFGFLFLSLLIFFVGIANGWGQGIIYVTFILYIAATAGSIIYLASVARSLRRMKNAE